MSNRAHSLVRIFPNIKSASIIKQDYLDNYKEIGKEILNEALDIGLVRIVSCKLGDGEVDAIFLTNKGKELKREMMRGVK